MKALLATIALAYAAPSLLASADLVIIASLPSSSLLRAGYNSGLSFIVHNNGPDVAPAVTVSVSSTVPITCSCNLGDIRPGDTRSSSVSFLAPATDGTITFSGTASSSAPDPNPGDNTTSAVLTVSTDPDVQIRLSTPLTHDLALPLTVAVFLSNTSKATAHDVEATIDFRTDVSVSSLPEGCSSTGAGRVVCRLDSLPPTTINTPSTSFSLPLVAPTTYGLGSVTFTAVAVEREHDFDPISNTTTRQMALYKTFYVFSTANDGGGSLRQAILNANAQCLGNEACAIAFRIDQGPPGRWKTIYAFSPLPVLTAQRVRIDGATQTAFFGNTNPDGPEIEITGNGATDSDGLVVNCGAEVANLAINGFLRNGISIAQPLPSSTCTAGGTTLHHLFIGTDPTGTIARPNARGIGTSFANGTDINSIRGAANIQDSVISGNLHSGIFGLSGRLNVSRNRIGVKAHSDDPLPNGNAGVFIGPGGYGSDVGAPYFATRSGAPDREGNVIAFNGAMGVAVAAGVADVAIRNNHIWGNALLGIDIGLDGPTQTSATAIPIPSLTLAHYDPVTRQTVIDGDASATNPPSTFSTEIDFFANDAPDPTGLGEGQRPLGIVQVPRSLPAHFRFTVDGDLTGQFISATMTRVRYIGFAKPEGIDSAFLTQTSEFSPTIEVR